MSMKQRYISTSFWDDRWVSSLEPQAKLLYLYLLTNPLTNIAGVYKISPRRICFDTGLQAAKVEQFLDEFAQQKKANIYGEYMILPAWPQHQKWWERSKVKLGIISVLQDLPPDLIQYLENINYRFDLSLINMTIIAEKNRVGLSGTKKKKLIKAAGCKCVECGVTDKLTIHHILPVEKGGDNSDANLKVLCEACHLKLHPSGYAIRIPDIFPGVRNYPDSDSDPDSDRDLELENTLSGHSPDSTDAEVSQFLRKEEQETKRVPYSEIVDYLNHCAHKQFSAQNKDTQRKLKARWNEGYRIPDFQQVIDLKARQWLHDPKMVEFLRPQTLFGPKFESYLNDAKSKANQSTQEQRCPECGASPGYHVQSCSLYQQELKKQETLAGIGPDDFADDIPF